MKERVAVFVDGNNFYFLQRDELKFWIDPSNMLDWIENEFGSIVDAHYYASYDASDNKQDNYFKALPHMGYRVVAKEQRDSGRKTSVLADVVADIFCSKDRYDMAIIISGDASYASVVERLRTLGKGVKVISSGGFVGRELREAAGINLLDFNDYKKEVERVD